MSPRKRAAATAVAVAMIAACSGDDTEPVAGTVETTSTTVAPTTTGPTLPADTTSPPDPTSSPPDPTSSPPDPTSSPPDPTSSYDLSAADQVVADFVTEHQLDGAGLVVVERDAGIVHEFYAGEFESDRISLIASSSKMITAGVLLHLDDQGALDIDAPLGDIAAWGGEHPEVTPAQLVSNSSGLVGLLPDPGYEPYLCQFRWDDTLTGCVEAIATTPDDDGDIVPPDTEFRYGGAQWQMAGALAEVASGRSWAQLIDQIYVAPCELGVLGYTNHWGQPMVTGVDDPDDFTGDLATLFEYPDDFAGDPATLLPTDNPNMEGGAYTTAPDYARLLLMHLRDGMCGDTEVISPELLARAHGDRIGEQYDGTAFAPGLGYGMGWFVDRERGYIIDGGAYGSQPWLDLADGYGVVVFLEASAALGGDLGERLYDVIDAAMAAPAST